MKLAFHLAYKNLMGAGLRTWLNAGVLSFAFIAGTARRISALIPWRHLLAPHPEKKPLTEDPVGPNWRRR